MTKICFTCKAAKPASEFGLHSRSKDGLRGQCKKCRGSYTSEWCEKNIEAVRAKGRKYARKNSDERKVYMRARRTGFTELQFESQLAEQSGECAICKVSLAALPSKFVHADHDHATGKTRGVLCAHCNRGLGAFTDCPDKLERAAAYLRLYQRVDEVLS